MKWGLKSGHNSSLRACTHHGKAAMRNRYIGLSMECVLWVEAAKGQYIEVVSLTSFGTVQFHKRFLHCKTFFTLLLPLYQAVVHFTTFFFIHTSTVCPSVNRGLTAGHRISTFGPSSQIDIILSATLLSRQPHKAYISALLRPCFAHNYIVLIAYWSAWKAFPSFFSFFFLQWESLFPRKKYICVVYIYITSLYFRYFEEEEPRARLQNLQSLIV